jgi:hypothetical protein
MSRTARFRCIWPYATYIRHRHGSLWPCVVAAAVLIRPRRLVGTRRSSTGMRSRTLHRPAVALLAWDPRQWHQRHGTYRRPRRQGVTIPSTGRTRAGPLPLFEHVVLPLLRTRRPELSFSESRQRKSVASKGGRKLSDLLRRVKDVVDRPAGSKEKLDRILIRNFRGFVVGKKRSAVVGLDPPRGGNAGPQENRFAGKGARG